MRDKKYGTKKDGQVASVICNAVLGPNFFDPGSRVRPHLTVRSSGLAPEWINRREISA